MNRLSDPIISPGLSGQMCLIGWPVGSADLLLGLRHQGGFLPSSILPKPTTPNHHHYHTTKTHTLSRSSTSFTTLFISTAIAIVFLFGNADTTTSDIWGRGCLFSIPFLFTTTHFGGSRFLQLSAWCSRGRSPAVERSHDQIEISTFSEEPL